MLQLASTSSFFCCFSSTESPDFSISATSLPTSGSTKNWVSSILPVRVSIPLSVNSIVLCFSSITKYSSSVATCIFFSFSCIQNSSVFCKRTFTPGSLRYLMRALLLGIPLYARKSESSPASRSFSSALCIFALASARSLVVRVFCVRTRSSTRCLYSSKSWSSPFGTGPLIINGVRASSINTESTSSTIAQLCPRCTRSIGLVAILSRRQSKPNSLLVPKVISHAYARRRSSEFGLCLSIQSTVKPWNIYSGPIHSESRLAKQSLTVTTCTPSWVNALRKTGKVATRVLPSPVAISAIEPRCSLSFFTAPWSTTPPMSWTS